MKENNNNLMTLEEFKDKYFGKPGTPERDELDAGYEEFKLGVLKHATRKNKGITQEELAKKVGF